MAANLILGVQIYLWIGVGCAALFLSVGLDRIDDSARGAWVFRPLLIPGIALLWPLVLWRWWQLEREGAEGQGRYRPPLATQPRAALILALVIPVIIAGALIVRQDGPTEARAQLIEPPQ